MRHPDIITAAALGQIYLPFVRKALSVAPPLSVGFVCEKADELAHGLTECYAPAAKRFGSYEGNGVEVFALTRADALSLLIAPQHVSDCETRARIVLVLASPRTQAVVPCVCIATGAFSLLDVSKLEATQAAKTLQ